MWIIENLLRVANNSQLQQPTRPGNAWEWDHAMPGNGPWCTIMIVTMI